MSARAALILLRDLVIRPKRALSVLAVQVSWQSVVLANAVSTLLSTSSLLLLPAPQTASRPFPSVFDASALGRALLLESARSDAPVLYVVWWTLISPLAALGITGLLYIAARLLRVKPKRKGLFVTVVTASAVVYGLQAVFRAGAIAAGVGQIVQEPSWFDAIFGGWWALLLAKALRVTTACTRFSAVSILAVAFALVLVSFVLVGPIALLLLSPILGGFILLPAFGREDAIASAAPAIALAQQDPAESPARRSNRLRTALLVAGAVVSLAAVVIGAFVYVGWSEAKDPETTANTWTRFLTTGQYLGAYNLSSPGLRDQFGSADGLQRWFSDHQELRPTAWSFLPTDAEGADSVIRGTATFSNGRTGTIEIHVTLARGVRRVASFNFSPAE